jgi:CubicO group peptidase (beta-lactamase class C family)
MSPVTQILDDIDESNVQILDISNTARCAIVCGLSDLRLRATYHKSDTGRAKRDEQYNEELLFQMASLFKVFIASGVILMIDKLSADQAPENPYRKLMGAWDRPFAEVFDKVAGHRYPKLGSLPGNPTVEQLLVHFNGVDNINHLLVAVDGTPLLSSLGFLDFISQYTEDTGGQHEERKERVLYSNSNYILLALLIDAASGSLQKFLERCIFKPFEMTRTFLMLHTLHSQSESTQRQSYVVSSNRRRRAFMPDEVLGLTDIVNIAWLGPYTSATDLSNFFGGIMSALDGKTFGLFDKAVAESLCRGWAAFDGETGYKRCGLYTDLKTKWPGSHSLNRLLSPKSNLTTHVLDGRPSDKEENCVFYLSGTATGWGHTAYLIPDKRTFVLVLTNTSGPVDASDLISRLCLQEILDLQPSNNLARRTKKWRNMTTDQRRRAHYVQMATTMFNENALVVKKLEQSNDQPGDILTSSCPYLPGKYSSKYGQCIEITDWRGENNDEEGVLCVTIGAGPNRSQRMRFAKKGDVFRICSRGPSQALAVDCFDAWKTLEFEVEQDKDGTRYLSRKGLNQRDYYRRDP